MTKKLDCESSYSFWQPESITEKVPFGINITRRKVVVEVMTENTQMIMSRASI